VVLGQGKSDREIYYSLSDTDRVRAVSLPVVKSELFLDSGSDRAIKAGWI
jgi:hypothetical protein